MAAKDYVAPVQANWPQAVAQPPCCQTQATAFSPAASYVPMLPVVNATGSFFNGQDYGLGFTMVPTSIVPTNAVPANNALTYGAFYPTGVIESPGKTSTLFPAASKSVLESADSVAIDDEKVAADIEGAIKSINEKFKLKLESLYEAGKLDAQPMVINLRDEWRNQLNQVKKEETLR
jgi:hypothetical protein